MIGIGVVVVVISGVLIYWKIPYSPFKAKFLKQMNRRVWNVDESSEICTAEEIAKLPEPLRRYSKYIGLENMPKYQAMRVKFKDTRFIFNTQQGKVLNMDYDLWLFYDQPYRSAFCSSSMYGVPFDGMDYCTEDRQGGMKGILGKVVQIFDVRDSQGYKASLISWIAESVALNPSVLLSPYLSYETMDSDHVKVTITYNGVSGTGIITLNEDGAITEFYSEERQVEELEGVVTPVGWRCECDNYKLQQGLCRPATVRSVKVLPDKEVVYFDSDHFTVEFLK